MASIVRAPMPGGWPVKQSLLLNILRSKRNVEKKNELVYVYPGWPRIEHAQNQCDEYRSSSAIIPTITGLAVLNMPTVVTKRHGVDHHLQSASKAVFPGQRCEKSYHILTLPSHHWLFLLRATEQCIGPTCVNLMSYFGGCFFFPRSFFNRWILPELLSEGREAAGLGGGAGASAKSWLQRGSFPSTLRDGCSPGRRGWRQRLARQHWVNRAVHRFMRADATECWRRQVASCCFLTLSVFLPGRDWPAPWHDILHGWNLLCITGAVSMETLAGHGTEWFANSIWLHTSNLSAERWVKTALAQKLFPTYITFSAWTPTPRLAH